MATTMAVCRVLFVCSLCLAWCSVAMATKDTQGDESIEKAKKEAGGAISVGRDALAWQNAVSQNATSLLSALEKVFKDIRNPREKEKATEHDKLQPESKAAVENLEKAINAAVVDVQSVVNKENTTLKVDEMKDAMDELHRKLASGDGGAKTAAEVQEGARRIAKLWEKAKIFFELQRSAAHDASTKTAAAVKAAEAVTVQSTGTNAEDVKDTKAAVDKAKKALPPLLSTASLLETAAKVVKAKAEEALQAFSKATMPATAPHGTQGGGVKNPEGGATESKIHLRKDSASAAFNALKTSHLTALLVFLCLLI